MTTERVRTRKGRDPLGLGWKRHGENWILVDTGVRRRFFLVPNHHLSWGTRSTEAYGRLLHALNTRLKKLGRPERYL